MLKITFVVSIITSCILDTTSSTGNDCEILCGGTLFNYIQLARIFNDSKHFVDMKLKYSPATIKKNFDSFLENYGYHPKNDALKHFVINNLDPPGYDIENWNPTDWTPYPSIIDKIYDPQLREWALELNNIWKNLSRKMPSDVFVKEEYYSQIYVPYPFFIPGGRFRELYYWDSFWVIDGLLLTDMDMSAKYSIKNFLYLVDKYGYIPNGSRKYYLGRSQPPFLIPMFYLYLTSTNDVRFLTDNILLLEKELKFWFNNRSLLISMDGEQHTVFHYSVKDTSPRPESYFEDVAKADFLNSDDAKNEFYSEIRAAAESGWDFSSKWFLLIDNHTLNITDIHTSIIAPVSLNSLMCYNARILAELFNKIGHVKKYSFYSDIADKLNKTFNKIFWDDQSGIWLDFNLEKKHRLPGFYVSNLMPLWTDTYGYYHKKNDVVLRVIDYLKKLDVLSFPGGIPVSLINSHQQWDFPETWAPFQYIVIMGLRKTGNKQAMDLAYSIAEKWLLNTYKSYMNSSPHMMFEKYDVRKIGKSGEGGEYRVQTGFGWTNGVALRILDLYGDKLRASKQHIFVKIIVSCLFLIAFLLIMRRFRKKYRITFKIFSKYFIFSVLVMFFFLFYQFIIYYNIP